MTLTLQRNAQAVAKALVLLAGASTLSLATALSASAQDAPAAGATSEVGEIAVTGTRIRGVAPTGSTLIEVGQEQIANTGIATTADVLRTTPQVTFLGAGEDYSGGSPFQGATLVIDFSKAINLRGIGRGATLNMINGHRVPYNGATMDYFDPDAIPAQMLQRVEVVADGGSAIYGADAIAGTVNYILRKPFDGAETYLTYGNADPRETKQFTQLWSEEWGSGGFVLAFQRTEQDALPASSRPNLYTDDFSAYGGSGSPVYRTILAGGTTYAIPGGRNRTTQVPLSAIGAAGTVNRLNSWTNVESLPTHVRDSLALNFTQDLGDIFHLKADSFWSERDYSIDQWGAVSTLSVPNTNPFSPCNPANSPSGPLVSLCAAGSLSVPYNFIYDLGPTTRAGYETTNYSTVSMSIDLPAEWQFNALAGKGKNRRYYNAIGRIGAIANALNSTNPANAFNPFCDGATFGSACNAASVSAFGLNTNFVTNNEMWFENYSVNLDGPVFSLPGGDVRVALGGEVQEIDYQASNSFGVSPEKHRKITSGYVEVFIPFVGEGNAMPGIQSLALDLAGRIDQYDDIDTETTNPKVGLTWSPIADVTLKASYGTSFRAPTLLNTDPTAAHGWLGSAPLGAAINSNRPGVCVGCNAPVLRAATVGGGLTTLEPETAETWSGGLEWAPESISGLRFSANYYRVKYEDKIDTPAYNVGSTAAISTGYYDGYIIYNPAFFPTLAANNPAGFFQQSLVGSSAACTAALGSPITTQAAFNQALACINTNADGPILFTGPLTSNDVIALIDGRQNNTGVTETDGIDVNVSYTWDNSLGTWRVGGSGQFSLSYKTAAVPTAPLADEVNHFGGYPLSFRGRAEFGWDGDVDGFGLSATAFVNYANEYEIRQQYLPGGVTGPLDIDAYTTVDLTFIARTQDAPDYGLVKNLSFSLSVQNAFDAEPPLVLNSGANGIHFDPSNASPLGRSFMFQIGKQW
ncbi:MAG: TonB-dependent receptor [Hyphomonadaceae bacterium]|nr:TonB-dependent receptor [Hyphomonadaceae bacterium]